MTFVWFHPPPQELAASVSSQQQEKENERLLEQLLLVVPQENPLLRLTTQEELERLLVEEETPPSSESCTPSRTTIPTILAGGVSDEGPAAVASAFQTHNTLSLQEKDNNNSSSSDDSDDEWEDVTLVVPTTTVPEKQNRPRFRLFRRVQDHDRKGHKQQQLRQLDVGEYMKRRQMTQLQETYNALTMIPPPLYCLYYILARMWEFDNDNSMFLGIIPTTTTTKHNAEYSQEHWMSPEEESKNLWNLANETWTWCYDSFASAPTVVLCLALAFWIHAPCSFLYHYRYALSHGTHHWSRRLDQSMIHVGATLCAFATSYSIDYLVANVLFCIDCVYRQFQEKVRPRRNKVRLLLSFVAYTFPLLRHGQGVTFVKLWLVFAVGFWLFGTYPIGGWSHAAFHIVMTATPVLLLPTVVEMHVE